MRVRALRRLPPPFSLLPEQRPAHATGCSSHGVNCSSIFFAYTAPLTGTPLCGRHPPFLTATRYVRWSQHAIPYEGRNVGCKLKKIWNAS